MIVLHPSLNRALVAYGAGAILAGVVTHAMSPRRRPGPCWEAVEEPSSRAGALGVVRRPLAMKARVGEEFELRRQVLVIGTLAAVLGSALFMLSLARWQTDLVPATVLEMAAAGRAGESSGGVARGPSPRELSRAATQPRARRGRRARRRMTRTVQGTRTGVPSSSAEASPAGVQARRRPPERLRASASELRRPMGLLPPRGESLERTTKEAFSRVLTAETDCIDGETAEDIVVAGRRSGTRHGPSSGGFIRSSKTTARSVLEPRRDGSAVPRSASCDRGSTPLAQHGYATPGSSALRKRAATTQPCGAHMKKRNWYGERRNCGMRFTTLDSTFA